MRRTAPNVRNAALVAGIISAHAETSYHVSLRGHLWRDHLRACGEQIEVVEFLVERVGSSPRMRRTAARLSLRDAETRIISAHAENRNRPHPRHSPRKDHLRACGEQVGTTSGRGIGRGSSPRMRRTAFQAAGLVWRGRIISAHAENRKSRCPFVASISDHLRACGEQCSTSSSHGILLGSSPRMRRTVHRELRRRGCRRIISAHAENRSVNFG